MVPPPLPHELSDHIIDFLHDDRQTLSACSLTCRAWLATARFHRFSTTTVRGRLQPFLDLLECSPDIAPYVHVLHLNGASLPTYRRHDTADLLSVLNKLPTFTHLILTAIRFDDDLATTLASNPSFKSIKGLTISSCYFLSTSDVARLAAAPALEHLAFESVVSDNLDEIDIPPPPICSLGIAGLWCSPTLTLATWAQSATNTKHIQRLRARIEGPFCAHTIAPWLESLDGSLHEVDLTVDTETNLQGE